MTKLQARYVSVAVIKAGNKLEFDEEKGRENHSSGVWVDAFAYDGEGDDLEHVIDCEKTAIEENNIIEEVHIYELKKILIKKKIVIKSELKDPVFTESLPKATMKKGLEV
jgi:hypothetical protein